MTTRLIIDDERSLVGAAHARSSAEAIACFAAAVSPGGEVWFDHDLGGSDTAMRVVDWLEEQAAAGVPLPLNRAVVHSANPVGAQRLQRALEKLVPTLRASPTLLESSGVGDFGD